MLFNRFDVGYWLGIFLEAEFSASLLWLNDQQSVCRCEETVATFQALPRYLDAKESRIYLIIRVYDLSAIGLDF